MSNIPEFLIFAGRVFHSLACLSATTEQDVHAERSPLFIGTTNTSLPRAFVDCDRVLLVIAGFTSRSERYPGVRVRIALNVTSKSLYLSGMDTISIKDFYWS